MMRLCGWLPSLSRRPLAASRFVKHAFLLTSAPPRIHGQSMQEKAEYTDYCLKFSDNNISGTFTDFRRCHGASATFLTRRGNVWMFLNIAAASTLERLGTGAITERWGQRDRYPARCLAFCCRFRISRLSALELCENYTERYLTDIGSTIYLRFLLLDADLKPTTQ